MTAIRTTDIATWRRLSVIVLRQLVRSLEAEGIESVRTVDLAAAVTRIEERDER